MNEYDENTERLENEIAQLKRDNARLQEKLNAALDGTGLCLWEQHIPTGSLTIFNMEWGAMLGYQTSELTATVDTWKSKLHPEDYDLAVGAFEDHIAGKTDHYQVIHRMVHKDGSDSWVLDRGRIVEFDSQGQPIRMMGTHIDITQEKRYELQLAKLASTDPLTGLLNRKALEQHYDSIETDHSVRSAMIFIDVDNFKSVNDELGHKVGDILLIEIAEWIREISGPEGHAARLGGDEFVIFFAQCDLTQLEAICQRLLAFTSYTLSREHAKVTIGFSIGACQFQRQEQSFDAIYQHTDDAMYQIKKHGKNSVAIVTL